MESRHSKHAYYLPNEKMKIVHFSNHFKAKRSPVIKLIVFLNCLGWITVIGMRFFQYMNPQPDLSYRLLGFDFIYFTTAILLSILGLWNMKSWGWGAGIMVNTIWIYSLSLISSETPYVSHRFDTFFFIAFATIAFFSTLYLWKKRYVFWR